MSSAAWINWSALGKILGVGLLAGAGLPAIFAIGLRLVSSPESMTAGSPVAAGGLSVERRAPTPALILGGILFAVVLAALGYGIYLIVNG
jgi:hypothetical protein